MASTTIDSRGTIDSDGGSGLNINVATVVSASVELSGSASTRNVLPYRLTTTLLDQTSGTITWGGHYTINRSAGGSLSGSYVMPTIASTIGSVFVVQNINGVATHVLTGSETGTVKVFTTGSLSGSAVTAGATAGSRLVLPASGSVILMNTGDMFTCIGISAGAVQVLV